MKKKDMRWLRLPLLYCQCCKNCKFRNPQHKNLFNGKYLFDCINPNDVGISTIIPGVLWVADWCKVARYENENLK